MLEYMVFATQSQDGSEIAICAMLYGTRVNCIVVFRLAHDDIMSLFSSASMLHQENGKTVIAASYGDVWVVIMRFCATPWKYSFA